MATAVLLVPSDFSTCAREAMRLAARLAPSLDGSLVLLHVGELPPGLSESSMIRPTPDLAPISAGQFVRDAAQGELERYARELRESGVEVKTRVELGNPIDVILEVSDEIEPAMIVMGTQGRTGLAHFLIGSVAEKIMRKSDRPVLTVPAAAAEHEEQLEVVER